MILPKLKKDLDQRYKRRIDQRYNKGIVTSSILVLLI